jgi:hypothetical protein
MTSFLRIGFGDAIRIKSDPKRGKPSVVERLGEKELE